MKTLVDRDSLGEVTKEPAARAFFEAITQRLVLPLLLEAQWHDPMTARMDRETYMAYVIAGGYCLNGRCPEPPFHCHVPEDGLHREVRRLLSQ